MSGESWRQDPLWQRDRERRRRTKLVKRADGTAVAVPLGAPITMQVSLPTGQVLERAHLRLVDAEDRSRWQAETTAASPAEDFQKRAGTETLGLSFDVAADEEDDCLEARNYEVAYTVRQPDGQRFTIMTCGPVTKGHPSGSSDLACAFVGEFSDPERRSLFRAAAHFAGEHNAVSVFRTASGAQIATATKKATKSTASTSTAEPVAAPTAPDPTSLADVMRQRRAADASSASTSSTREPRT